MPFPGSSSSNALANTLLPCLSLRLIEFMRALPIQVVKSALQELALIPVVKDGRVSNKASYLMGLLKRFQVQPPLSPGVGPRTPFPLHPQPKPPLLLPPLFPG